MRRDDAFFGDQDLVLVYTAKRLTEAKDAEGLFDQSGIDYLVELDTYRGGTQFPSELIGAYFHVSAAQQEAARSCLRVAGLVP